MNWQNNLEVLFHSNNKISILGAGSVLCGDDAAGMLLIDRLKKGKAGKTPRLQLLSGSTAPENFTGEIKKFYPSVLILVDAVLANREVGEIFCIETNEIKATEFSTHMLPFPIMMNYLEQEISCPTVIFGIQPQNMDFASETGEKVLSAIELFASKIEELI